MKVAKISLLMFSGITSQTHTYTHAYLSWYIPLCFFNYLRCYSAFDYVISSGIFTHTDTANRPRETKLNATPKLTNSREVCLPIYLSISTLHRVWLRKVGNFLFVQMCMHVCVQILPFSEKPWKKIAATNHLRVRLRVLKHWLLR